MRQQEELHTLLLSSSYTSTAQLVGVMFPESTLTRQLHFNLGHSSNYPFPSHPLVCSRLWAWEYAGPSASLTR